MDEGHGKTEKNTNGCYKYNHCSNCQSLNETIRLGLIPRKTAFFYQTELCKINEIHFVSYQ